MNDLRKDVMGVCFGNTLNYLANLVHQNAINKGWRQEDRNDGEIIALIHSELSEALEGLRRGNPPSDKIPEFLSSEEELADAVIRIMDYAKARNWRLGEAILAKIEYNSTRPYMRGKQF